MKLKLILILICFICDSLSFKMKNKYKLSNSQNYYSELSYSTDDIISTAAGMVPPTYVDKLPINLNSPYTGVVAEADGKIRNKYYYNGKENLNAKIIDCGTISQSQCFNSDNCGWCGNTNSCVKGNPLGPISGCLKKYFFFKNDEKWNMFKSDTNLYAVDKNLNPALIKVPHPNLEEIKVDIKNN